MTTSAPDPVHPSLNILPYRALLRRGGWDARKSMVMSLYASSRGEAHAVLGQALQDPDERLRLLAAQALEKLTESFQRSAQGHRRAIENDPADADLRLTFARMLLDRAVWSGRADAGLAACEEAARHAAAAVDTGLTGSRLDAANALLGRALARLGRTGDARRALEKVPPSAPEYFACRLAWAETWLVDGDLNAVRSEMRRLLSLNPPPEVGRAARFWAEPS